MPKQKYFSFNGKLCIQNDSLAMGAPPSAIFSAIYLQHNKCNNIIDSVTKYHFLGYFGYTYAILVIHNNTLSDINSLLTEFNKINPKLTFTSKKETCNKIHFSTSL
jgi:hypothetical protein